MCSWFQSMGVISIWSVYFTSSLFTVPNGRVGQLPWIRVLVRNQLSTSPCPSTAAAIAWPSCPCSFVLRSDLQQRQPSMHTFIFHYQVAAANQKHLGNHNFFFHSVFSEINWFWCFSWSTGGKKLPELCKIFALGICRAGREGCIFVIVLFMCANCKQLFCFSVK